MRNISGYDLIIKPIVTEKSSNIKDLGKYIFKVHSTANKTSIKKSFEMIFKVKVQSVNILHKPSKKKLFKGVKGSRAGYKKAIITTLAKKTIDLGV